jgi:hypothetical protein
MRTSMFLLAVALLGCRAGGRPTTVSPPYADAATLTSQVTAQLTRAAGDWNRGNLEGFLSDYSPESTTSFVDGRRTRHGIDFIRQYYTPRFAAGPFTLVMEQQPEGWRILHDHSSSDPH